MLKMQFSSPPRSPLKILFLGAHSDDIEIGCGGTILKLLNENAGIQAVWVVFSATGSRAAECLESANIFLADASQKEIIVKEFRDGYFPYIGEKVKNAFEDLKGYFNPDLIFTPYRHDLHQDHRLVSELTWNTFRDNMILEYEVLKYDGDIGNPNFYVPLERELCEKKIDSLMHTFKTQFKKDWFTPEAFFSVLRLRGVECRAPGKYAEAFYCRKIIL